MEKVFEIYIKTTPERLWEAITDWDIRRKYTFGSPPPGESKVVESEPPSRHVESFIAEWNDAVKAEGETRITWEIEPIGTSCRLRITHDHLREGANEELFGGWPMIVSGLKTLLETGELLDTPGSLMYAKYASES